MDTHTRSSASLFTSSLVASMCSKYMDAGAREKDAGKPLAPNERKGADFSDGDESGIGIRQKVLGSGGLRASGGRGLALPAFAQDSLQTVLYL